MAEIVRIEAAGPAVLADINSLLRQLSAHATELPEELLARILASDTHELWAAKEGGRIVGMGELVVILKPEGVYARIEDVVVDEAVRGKGLGKAIMEKLIERARACGAKDVALTTRPAREAANALYQKLGFEKRDTNAYRLTL